MDDLTAKISCFARAYHYRNNTTHVFADTAAEQLLGKDEFKTLLKTINGIVCEGSFICFDYPSKDGGRETRINQALARGAGEQMKAPEGVCYILAASVNITGSH